MAVLSGNSFSPWAGEFYKAADGIRFRLRQKIDTTTDYTHAPNPSYIAASAHIIGATPTRNTSASYPYWRFDLRNELAAALPFANEPVDNFFDVPFIKDADGIKLDNTGLIAEQTITVPVATSENDLVIQYPTNDADPPIVTAINASASFDYTISYYGGSGAVARANFGTLGNGRANTFVDVRVTFPSATASGETRFYNQLNVYKPPLTGVWTVAFALTLRQNNHNSRAYTY